MPVPPPRDRRSVGQLPVECSPARSPWSSCLRPVGLRRSRASSSVLPGLQQLRCLHQPRCGHDCFDLPSMMEGSCAAVAWLEAAKLLEPGKEAGYWTLSTLREPYRVEGKKTIGLRAGRAVRLELCPTGSSTPGRRHRHRGMHKAFDELQRLGLIGPRRPRFVVVQAAGLRSHRRAFEQGKESAESPGRPQTRPGDCGCRGRSVTSWCCRRVAETVGRAVAIDEDRLEKSRRLDSLMRTAGGSRGAAALAAVEDLEAAGTFVPASGCGLPDRRPRTMPDRSLLRRVEKLLLRWWTPASPRRWSVWWPTVEIPWEKASASPGGRDRGAACCDPFRLCSLTSVRGDSGPELDAKAVCHRHTDRRPSFRKAIGAPRGPCRTFSGTASRLAAWTPLYIVAVPIDEAWS